MSEDKALDEDFYINPKKVVTVGDMGVGKTSIINAIKGEDFTSDVISTIGASYVQCTCPVDNGTLLINFWDTAGQERFQSLIPLYLRNADACIIVFDITREKSIEMLDNIYDNIRSGPSQPDYFILCANKMDLVDENKVSTASYEDWAKEKHIEFLPTSAKTGLNIDILFTRITTKLTEDNKMKVRTETPVQPKKSNKSCC